MSEAGVGEYIRSKEYVKLAFSTFSRYNSHVCKVAERQMYLPFLLLIQLLCFC